jgi:hypothetical protein
VKQSPLLEVTEGLDDQLHCLPTFLQFECIVRETYVPVSWQFR